MPTIPFDVVAWLPACGKSITLTGVAADALTIRPPFDCYVVGVAARVTTATGGATLPAIAADVADADGSTNRVEAAALTFTTDDDAGDLRVAMLEPVDYRLVDVSAGRVIVLEHKTAAAGGGAAGVADCFVLLKLAGRSEFKDV